MQNERNRNWSKRNEADLLKNQPIKAQRNQSRRNGANRTKRIGANRNEMKQNKRNPKETKQNQSKRKDPQMVLIRIVVDFALT
jgi:hypothetical protein